MKSEEEQPTEYSENENDTTINSIIVMYGQAFEYYLVKGSAWESLMAVSWFYWSKADVFCTTTMNIPAL